MFKRILKEYSSSIAIIAIGLLMSAIVWNYYNKRIELLQQSTPLNNTMQRSGGE